MSAKKISTEKAALLDELLTLLQCDKASLHRELDILTNHQLVWIRDAVKKRLAKSG